MKSKDAQSPLGCIWDSSRMGPGGSPREACPKDNQIRDAGSLLPPYVYQGRGHPRSDPSRGEAKASHLLLHQVQGQGSTVRQGR